jgi:hypothetical protein
MATAAGDIGRGGRIGTAGVTAPARSIAPAIAGSVAGAAGGAATRSAPATEQACRNASAARFRAALRYRAGDGRSSICNPADGERTRARKVCLGWHEQSRVGRRPLRYRAKHFLPSPTAVRKQPLVGQYFIRRFVLQL